MNSVGDCHERPKRKVLHLGGDDTCEDAAAAEPLEDGTEESSVGRVQSQCPRPTSTGEPAEESKVGVRRPVQPSERGFGSGPEDRCGRSSEHSSPHRESLFSARWPSSISNGAAG